MNDVHYRSSIKIKQSRLNDNIHSLFTQSVRTEMISLFVRVIFIHCFVLISINASSSTCSKSKKPMCDTFPFNVSDPPDVWLNAPDVSVDQIWLTAKNFKTRVSLSANVASLLSVNAGVDINIDQVNLTIKGEFDMRENSIDSGLFLDFSGQIQLAMHLDNIAQIITRTMASLDLNPLLVRMADHSFGKSNHLVAVFTENEQVIHQIINRGRMISST